MSRSEQLTFTTEDAAGLETTHVLPHRFEVCPCCEGKGSRVNPAVDGHGISPEEFAEDPDFEEAYFSGRYDITCDECQGLRVVMVPDEQRADPVILEAYFEHRRAEAEYRRCCQHEREMGY